MKRPLTLEQMLEKEEDGVLLDIYEEITSGVVPATCKSHEYCRQCNRLIDEGEMCINPSTHRKVYLPTLAKAVRAELANRYVTYCCTMKGGEF